MGNIALQAVCVRDDSLELYTEELNQIEDNKIVELDSVDITESINDTMDKDLSDKSLEVYNPQDTSKNPLRRHRAPRRILRSIMPRVASTTSPSTPLDAYDEVCEEFSIIFDQRHSMAPKSTEEEEEYPIESSIPYADLILEKNIRGFNNEVLTLADWPSHTWKIDMPIREEEDDMCSTTCSSDCADESMGLTDDEDETTPISTFACTYRRSTSSVISMDEVPFELTSRSMYIVSDYICPCGDCPWYEVIEKQVSKSLGLSTKEKKVVCRILQAYSTYNEVIGFRTGMIRIAQDCLFTSTSGENEAFQAFVDVVESQYANGWI